MRPSEQYLLQRYVSSSLADEPVIRALLQSRTANISGHLRPFISSGTVKEGHFNATSTVGSRAQVDTSAPTNLLDRPPWRYTSGAGTGAGEGAGGVEMASEAERGGGGGRRSEYE